MTREKFNLVLAGVLVGLSFFLISASKLLPESAQSASNTVHRASSNLPTNSPPQQVTATNLLSTNSIATTTVATNAALPSSSIERPPLLGGRRASSAVPSPSAIHHSPSALPNLPTEWSIEFFQPQQPLKCPPDLKPIGPETDPTSGLPLRVKNDDLAWSFA